MIYLKPTDPADAKPGDFMIENCKNELTDNKYLKVSLCIKTKSFSVWHKVYEYYYSAYPDEIVDGKPTPALIARFSQGEKKAKTFNVFGHTFIEKPWGIIQVPPVDSVWLGDNSCGRREYIVYATNMKKMQFALEKDAERAREQLIAWLEG